MHPIRFTLTVIMGIVVLITLAKAIEWFTKRKSLGPVLWTGSGGKQSLALLFMIGGLPDVASGIYSREYDRLIGGTLLFALGRFLSVPLGRLRVCEKGIETGMLVLPWAQITGWGWGPKPGDDSGPASLPTGGPDERQLYIWTLSRWRLLYDPRPARALTTTVPFDERLNSLIEEKIPRKPAPQTT